MGDLANRVAVVTGAASGVGLATARILRSSKTSIIGIDLADEPAEFRSDDGVKWVRGDVASGETWERVIEECLSLGPSGPDCLVACAADIVIAPFLDTSLEEWHRIFDVNIFGVILAMRALIPSMLQRGQGAIAVVCSVNSLYAEDQLSAYSTSKAALLQVVRSAALEYAPRGLRINAVLPGFIDTALLQRALSDHAARRAAERRTPTGQILRAEEVATVLCFLVSEAASGLSGAAVTVDGGLTTAYDFDSSD